MMGNERNRPQFLDGWKANQMLIRLESNPYDRQTQWASRREWNAGWHERQRIKLENEAFLEAMDKKFLED